MRPQQARTINLIVGATCYLIGILIIFDLLVNNQNVFPDLIYWISNPVYIQFFQPFLPLELPIIFWITFGFFFAIAGISMTTRRR